MSDMLPRAAVLGSGRCLFLVSPSIWTSCDFVRLQTAASKLAPRRDCNTSCCRFRCPEPGEIYGCAAFYAFWAAPFSVKQKQERGVWKVRAPFAFTNCQRASCGWHTASSVPRCRYPGREHSEISCVFLLLVFLEHIPGPFSSIFPLPLACSIHHKSKNWLRKFFTSFPLAASSQRKFSPEPSPWHWEIL